MKKFFLFLIVGLITHSTVDAQATYAELEKNTVVYPSPTAGSLGKYGEYGVSLYNGLVNIGQDIVTVKSGKLAVNVSLSYHGSGNRPSDIPGWVGLGFSLNAGGVITRVIKDMPDDYLYGFYYSNDAVKYDWDNYPNTHFVERYYTGEIDPRSDVYQFNFCGKTGEFVFDLDRNIHFKQKVPFKVEIAGLTDGFGAFIVTTDDGTVYTFDQTERSMRTIAGISGGSSAASSWYLTKIKNLSGDSIVLKYTTPTNKYRFTTSGSRKEVTGTFYDPGVPGDVLITGPTINLNTHAHQVVYLDEIDFSEGKLLFGKSRRFDPYYSPSGYDTSEIVEKKLDLITLEDNDETVIKKWRFEYFENSTERLKLKNLVVQANDDTDVQKYSFEYSYLLLPLPLPGPVLSDPYFSNDVDYWGYYNGFANNDNKIPKQYNKAHNQWFGTANRSVNPLLGNAEILEKIVYPTGGYAAFEYEANDYSAQGVSFAADQNPMVQSATDLTESFEVDYDRDGGGFAADPSTMTFTLTDTTHINVRYSCGADGPLHSWGNPGTAYEYDYQALPGSYSIQGILQTNTLLDPGSADINRAHGYVTVYKMGEMVPIAAKAGPGLRIKSIVNSDGISTTTRRFEYKLSDTSAVSSGYLSVFPAFQSDLESLASNIFGIYIASDPINDIGEGAPIGYSRVVERFQDNSYIVHSYTNYGDQPDEINSFTNSYSDHKLAHMTSYDFLRGLEKITKYYNADGVIQKMTSNSYDTLPGSLTNVQSIELKPTVSITDGSSGVNNVNGTLTTLYYVASSFLYKNATTEEVFDKNGANPIVTTVNNYYDNLTHLQPTRVQTNASDGSVVVTATSFADDFASGVSFIDYMQANHLKSFPVEQVVYIEKGGVTKIISGNLITYKAEGAGLPYELRRFETAGPVLLSDFKFANRSLGVLPPSSSPSSYSADARYQTALTYSLYDSKGNLLESVKRDGIKTAYVWGYNQQLPVAEIVGSDYTTAYGKLTSPSILDNPSSDAALHTELNKIRTGLPNAMVKTYAYIPLTGISSQSDPPGRMVYYEYDSFGRLKLIRDQNSAIIKKFDYKYSRQ